MRPLIPLFLLLAACSDHAAVKGQPDVEVWTAGTRDRLCIKGNQAGFIVFGKDDSNCSARGRLSRDGDTIRITPTGETKCFFEGDEWIGDGPRRMMALGPSETERGACNYYCGPGASLKDVQFELSKDQAKTTDLAGDPLC